MVNNNNDNNKYFFIEDYYINFVPRGWQSLYNQLLEDINSIIDKDDTWFRIVEVKEKYCSLTIYYEQYGYSLKGLESNNDNINNDDKLLIYKKIAAIDKLINKASEKSEKMCFRCGKPIKQHQSVLCNSCREELNVMY